ncbi:Hypothetical Protein FCC1311_036562 [Hondaea fermentalgiana]|uniref:Uncharacterized protein n=1 Tax=Hondaea fermentalgiana TaxID=2315210 RepID=A0A2R5GA29_9STRA|nr:Hypothetical Protein FCC1311_036562 [Hondaea fermentalgiana]|eukprot:GBG27435.1 Hypothetical Protein FCC1311_036562 [Hondaea fermentalgiana]
MAFWTPHCTAPHRTAPHLALQVAGVRRGGVAYAELFGPAPAKAPATAGSTDATEMVVPRELREQLEQLRRATLHYRQKMSQVSQDLNREQDNYEQLRQLYEAQMARFQMLQQAQISWQDDIERKKEEVRSLREELDHVTLQWRKARQAELRNEELEETNRYLERLVITVAVTVPIALLAEKQLRSKM